jgi:ribonuclease VapC
MIVYSSAILAILRMEPDWQVFAERLNGASHSEMSAVTYMELCGVVDSLKIPELSGQVDELIEQCRIAIEPATVEQANLARQAFRDYGRGSGHPANLDFGDCFSYALARVKREPILFKGDGFRHTDLRPAIAS